MKLLGRHFYFSTNINIVMDNVPDPVVVVLEKPVRPESGKSGRCVGVCPCLNAWLVVSERVPPYSPSNRPESGKKSGRTGKKTDRSVVEEPEAQVEPKRAFADRLDRSLNGVKHFRDLQPSMQFV